MFYMDIILIIIIDWFIIRFFNPDGENIDYYNVFAFSKLITENDRTKFYKKF